MDEIKLLRTDEVALRLRISRATLYRRIAAGQIVAFRAGARGRLRIPEDAVDAFLLPAVHHDPERTST